MAAFAPIPRARVADSDPTSTLFVGIDAPYFPELSILDVRLILSTRLWAEESPEHSRSATKRVVQLLIQAER
jgi:hypothetical protein